MTETQLRKAFVDLALSYVGLYNGGKCPAAIASAYNDYISNCDTKIASLPRKTKMALDWAWCSCFASVMAIKAGYAMKLMPIELSCCNAIRMWMAMNRWQEADDYTPKPGDFIYFDWGGNVNSDSLGYATTDHVGIVTKVQNGKIYTVEGNRSSRVQEKSYDVGAYCISGFGCPDFDSIATEREPETTATAIETKLNNGNIWLGNLSRGDKGNVVKTMQTLLNLWGGADLDVDGAFGAKTKAALMTYQEQVNIAVDGVCGTVTWNHLLKGC